MASVVPFRALRPDATVAGRVAAVPYDVVSTEEARALAAGNPLSFLHVSRPEIDLPPATPPYADAVYAKAVENFATLKAQAPLVMESAPSLYIYRLRMRSHVQTGVAGCFSLDDYAEEVIRKHERTRPDKENDRTRHMLELRAQTGPVFLTYRAVPAIDFLVERAMATKPPMFDFTADDDVQHTVWRTEPRDEQDLVSALDAIPALYIADGHHRAASAARVRDRLRGATDATGEWDTFLAVAFPHDQVQVLPYNRVVTDLGGLTAESLIAALRERLAVHADGRPLPERRGDVGMFLDGRWYTLVLGQAPSGLAPGERLDPSRLQDAVLGPLLGIGDVRSDKRIDFVGGARGTAALEHLVYSAQAAVAFSMYPVSVDDLMMIADGGGIMPPKSTWFEPKLRDGLLSHVI